jgi:2-keto-4-pentenoate hydratase/2-oxohepta-3-ene-1,7-dioic acid hydratase in catechol pathway
MRSDQITSLASSPCTRIGVRPTKNRPARRRFPVHRIYCVGRNYVEHAKEMGFTGREPPFFFLKPADAHGGGAAGETGTMAYPPLTKDLHHEIELVVAIGTGGKNIKAADAHKHIYGYAVGLDMTRRDLQGEMKKQGRPWCIGKAFDQSRPSARSSRGPGRRREQRRDLGAGERQGPPAQQRLQADLEHRPKPSSTCRPPGSCSPAT